MSDVRVTMADCRSLGMCSRGVRNWFQARGLDYQRFLSEGLPVEDVEAIGDEFANRACEVARKGAQS